MAQISSYPILTPQLGDKLLGSNNVDSSGTQVAGNPTCQFNLTSVKALIDQSFIQQGETSSSALAQQDATSAATEITFGVLQDLTNVKIETNGKITLKTAGTYYIVLDYMYAQVSSTSNTTTLLFKRSLNDKVTQQGLTTSVSFKQNEAINFGGTPISIPIMLTTTLANQFYYFQIAETGTGASLVTLGNGISGFANTPCASITISKLI